MASTRNPKFTSSVWNWRLTGNRPRAPGVVRARSHHCRRSRPCRMASSTLSRIARSSAVSTALLGSATGIIHSLCGSDDLAPDHPARDGLGVEPIRDLKPDLACAQRGLLHPLGVLRQDFFFDLLLRDAQF